MVALLDVLEYKLRTVRTASSCVVQSARLLSNSSFDGRSLGADCS